jgi:hypothetical protein
MSTEVSKTILRQYQRNVGNVRHYNVCRVFRNADHIMLSVVAPVICTEPSLKFAFTSVSTDTWDSFQDLMRKMNHSKNNLGTTRNLWRTSLRKITRIIKIRVEKITWSRAAI